MRRIVTNPMILKELRQRLRDRRSWLLPTLYLLILSGTVAFAYYASTVIDRQNRQLEVQGADIGTTIFLTVVFTQLAVLLLMAPVFSAGSITIEKEQRTLASLLTSLLSTPQIWWGKFVTALLYLLLLLLSALPLLALSLAFGGVDPLDLFKVVAATILVLACMSAVGLWCSTMFRRTVHSIASCYGIVLVLTVVTAVVFGISVAHWSDQHPDELRTEGVPFYVQAPILLNPIYPFLDLIKDNELRRSYHPISSWLLFVALGCLAAAFAMRRLQRSGEQL
jgi:ABC-2 type transport system permease protein